MKKIILSFSVALSCVGCHQYLADNSTQDQALSLPLSVEVPTSSTDAPFVAPSPVQSPSPSAQNSGPLKELCKDKGSKHLLLFAGQSNMVGQEGNAAQAPTLAPDTAFEYKLNSNELVPLREPAGEYICADAACTQIIFTSQVGAQRKYFELGKGTLLSAFSKSYFEQSGRKVVAVHTAMGGTSLTIPGDSAEFGNWSELGYVAGKANLVYPLRKKAFEKLNAARLKTNLEADAIIWFQGESDSDRLQPYSGQPLNGAPCEARDAAANLSQRCLTEASYRNALKEFILTFWSSYHAYFLIIQTGYTASLADLGVDSMRAIQEDLVKNDPDIKGKAFIISQSSKTMFNDSTLMNVDHIHYTQKGLNILGTEAATELSKLMGCAN